MAVAGAKPPAAKLVKVKVTARAYINDTLVEPGDVIMVPEDMVYPEARHLQPVTDDVPLTEPQSGEQPVIRP